MKLQKTLKKKLRSFKKQYTIDWKMSAIVTMALIIGTMLFVMNAESQVIYIYDRGDTTIITTPVTTVPTTTSPTTTEPTTIPTVWYNLRTRIVWNAWVDVSRYRGIEVDASDLTYLCIGSNTYSRNAHDVWYPFDSFRVELNGQIYISAVFLTDPGDTFHYGTDPTYNLVSAGPWSGEIPFWDSSAPMPMAPAGWIRWDWVEV